MKLKKRLKVLLGSAWLINLFFVSKREAGCVRDILHTFENRFCKESKEGWHFKIADTLTHDSPRVFNQAICVSLWKRDFRFVC